ncbi:MAG: dTMP kinase [Proteobacteria bacterium]|nr:dTMP kinase [Desulfobacula sp.]MBU3954790.1 dTMP kinase [Pseudomonadota bacterium]MBU4131395.1 dTMP kinase [Pseudomonadota bacterium]
MGIEKGGRFLVFEGIDGSGKSTQILRTHERLIQNKQPGVATFEPTDGPIGSLIRQMLAGKVETDQLTIAALFAADRTDHLVNRKNGVRAMVDQGRVVLCDRYYFSSYAYHAQYMDMDWVIRANALNAQILRPTATLFIDVDPDVCLGRIRANRDCFDMYEKIDILKKVRENYFLAFERLKDQEKIIIIDGNGPPDRVTQEIWKQIQPLL